MLLKRHRDEWLKSGVSEYITKKNVWSIEDARELDSLLNQNTNKRWKHSTELVPGWAVAGIDVETGGLTFLGAQYKPDFPRSARDKAGAIKLDEAGNPKRIKYESPRGQALAPLFLDVPDPNFWRTVRDEKQQPVIFTEGAKKSGAALSLGFPCISLPGVSTGQKLGRLRAELLPFCGLGRRVLLAFDSDLMEKPSVRRALDQLGRLISEAGAVVSVILLPQETKGLDDFLTSPEVGEPEFALNSLIQKAPTLEEWRRSGQEKREGENSPERRSPFEMAFDLAREAKFFTIPGGAGTVAADVVIDGHRETFQISKRPQQFKDWLQYAMWQKHKKVLGSEILQQIMSVVSCEAKASGVQHKLHVRTASHEGAIYLDLGRPDWQMAKITEDGWSIIPSQECPIRFIRTSGIGEMPIPQPGGHLDDLRRIVNVDDQSFVLLMAWMLFCLCPDYDHPILIVSGSAESGKTKLCETIKTLVDPAPTLLMSLPKDERNLKAQATNRWLLGYDNLSGMGNEISDSLCRLATGGGLVDRKLHTDDDESEFAGVRPILLNGIDALGNRADFRSRGIELNCPPLEYKMTASEYKASLEAIRPTVLGLLLDAVSQALRLAPDHQHVTDTRMGDFECWGTTAETALSFPEGTFLSAFQANIVDLRSAGIESSPVATALMALMADCDAWEGTPSQLLVRLESLVTEDFRRSKFFPKDATRLSKTLKRVQTDLQQFLTITSEKRNGTRFISCKKVKNPSVPSVPEAQNPDYTTVYSRDATGTLRNPSVPSVPAIPNPGSLENSQGRYLDATENLASLPQTPSEQGFQPLRDARDAKIHPPFYVGCKVSHIDNPGWIGSLTGGDGDQAQVKWSFESAPIPVDWDDLVIRGGVNHAAMNGGVSRG